MNITLDNRFYTIIGRVMVMIISGLEGIVNQLCFWVDGLYIRIARLIKIS